MNECLECKQQNLGVAIHPVSCSFIGCLQLPPCQGSLALSRHQPGAIFFHLLKRASLFSLLRLSQFCIKQMCARKKSSMPCDSKLIKHRENVRNAHLLFSIFSFCSSILHLCFIFEVVLKPVQFFDLCSLKSATIFLRFFEMALLVSVTYEYKSYGYAWQIHVCAQSAL